MTDIFQETVWSSILEDLYDSWVNVLNREQYEAVSYYIEHGHKRINSTLRNDEVDEVINALDSALKLTNFHTSGVFYRGCDFFSRDVKVGDVFSSRTFFSTSVNPFEAMKFAGKNSPVLYRITADRGAQSIASYKHEQEVLFPRKEEFLITDITYDTSLKLYYPETDYFVSQDNVTIVNMTQK